MGGQVDNALTVDVEDYFHVSAFEQAIDPGNWGTYESRVEKNTARLLELFAVHDVSATFFVLGWVAERYPNIVKNISEAGHEIACHGFSHKLVYNQSPEVFREETIKSKCLLEDICQKKVSGYRAASYSITEKSRWALDILHETGFEYDSSIYPVRHDRYGIPNAPKFPYIQDTPNGNSIVEFPISSISVLGYQLPVAGGGYFRLYPYQLSRWALGRINRKLSKPFVFYLHPWEIDPEQPRIKAGLLSRFRHYNNLDKCEMRLRKLLQDFKFTTIRDVLGNLKLLNKD